MGRRSLTTDVVKQQIVLLDLTYVFGRGRDVMNNLKKWK